MLTDLYFFNNSKKEINIKKTSIKPYSTEMIRFETNSLELREIRKKKDIIFGKYDYIKNRIGGGKKMIVNVMNKAHWTIKINDYIFPPYKEVSINVGSMDYIYKLIRSNKNLRVGKVNNQDYIRRHKLIEGKKYNFIYDIISQHAGAAYKFAIEALAKPIFENLPQEETSFYNRPVPGSKEKGINCRFFNSARITEQGKCPVGPHDVFISHGIADKNYWIGNKIDQFNYAFCPGQIWHNRMRDTGYKGEIFITGYTKLDPLFQGKIEKVERDKPYVVWLPTHGYNNKHKGRSSYPMFLQYIDHISDKYIVSNGMHPTTKMHARKKQVPTIQELVDADVVIADAGSTLYEAWALEKPVIFPDWICKKDVMSHFSPDNLEYQIYAKEIGYHAKDMKHMNQLIERALQDGMKDEEKEFINGIFPEHLRGKSGETAARALIEIGKSF